MGKYKYQSLWMAALILLLSGCNEKQYASIGSDSAGIPGKTEAGVESLPPLVIDNGSSQQETSPSLLEEKEEPSKPEEETFTLLFSGDVLLSDHVLNAYDQTGGIHGVLDEHYRNRIADADFFFVNQEFPFSARGSAAPDKQYTFRLPPARIQLFQEMGIDGVTLANNHALDFGPEALLDSCDLLDQAGILHTGAGPNLEAARRPVTIAWKDKKIAVIGATRVIPVSSWAAGKEHPGMLAAYDMAILTEEIQARKQDHDFVIVCIHWGIERDQAPQEYQRTMARQMIDSGADLIIGSHPHVLQGMEYYKGKGIVYSLGNFVFGSSIPRTALLEVTWDLSGDQDQSPALRLIPGTSSAGYTRMLTEQDKLQEFFQYMESISFDVEIEEEGSLHPAPPYSESACGIYFTSWPSQVSGISSLSIIFSNTGSGICLGRI